MQVEVGDIHATFPVNVAGTKFGLPGNPQEVKLTVDRFIADAQFELIGRSHRGTVGASADETIFGSLKGSWVLFSVTHVTPVESGLNYDSISI